MEDYLETTVALAEDECLLASLRQKLRPMMARSPLMDAAAYLRDVEAAYRRIWNVYCTAQTPPDYGARRDLAAKADRWMAAGDVTAALAAADHILAARPANRPLLENLAVRYLDA